MLQEYPTQIQPRSSSTRGTQDSLHQESDSSNKIDAEASRILIDLANQGNDNLNTNNDMITSIKKTKAKAKSTENQSYLQQQQQQSDPIMLLAAAAAVIDNESNKYYKGRFYERREIKLYSRQQGSQKRKSYTYGINDDNHNTNESLFHRRHSEKRHRYQRSSISAQQPEDTWLPSREESKGGKHKEDSQHSFSWQFLSMKQNPRIKRNAMHAYITYMIYTDMAQEQQQKQYKKSDNNVTYNSNSTIQHHFPSSAPPPTATSITNTITTNDWFNNNSHHRSAPAPLPPPTATQPSSNTSLTMQSYRLPPSPRQKRHESPPTESIIGRPLTDFLFQGNNSNRSVNNHILPLPPPPQ